MSWTPPPAPQDPPLSAVQWLRVAGRAAAIAGIVFGGFALLLLLRLIERPLFGSVRPVTPGITCLVCRIVLAIMHLRVTERGPTLAGPGALVCNHVSWLDIFVLNSRRRLYFVAKSEVAGWPGIGWLARGTGTLFIRRDPRDARAQAAQLAERLRLGHRLLFFPEGTSTDGLRVLPFKPTLFAAFQADALRHSVSVQAASLVYRPAPGLRPDFFGWWGDMGFGPGLVRVLAQRRPGEVALIWHPQVRVDAFPNRKTLAAHLEAQVRAGLAAARA